MKLQPIRKVEGLTKQEFTEQFIKTKTPVILKDFIKGSPELYCGDKKSFNLLQEAITHLFSTENFTGLYYREESGNYWINLDYTARHPGGPYVDNKAYAVVEF